MTEFNLSEKTRSHYTSETGKEEIFDVIKFEDVKEFIRLLKDKFCYCDKLNKDCRACEKIDKLAGDKLNEEIKKRTYR